jgi:hypothetical protein
MAQGHTAPGAPTARGRLAAQLTGARFFLWPPCLGGQMPIRPVEGMKSRESSLSFVSAQCAACDGQERFATGRNASG